MARQVPRVGRRNGRGGTVAPLPSSFLDRMPPQNLEAEQGVLGSMLLDRDAIATAVEMVRPYDFYRDAHAVIYQAMVDLFERGEPVDLLTLTNALATQGKLDSIGGAPYLASLPDRVPTAANVEYYAEIVVDKSIFRALVNAGTQVAALGYEEGDDPAPVLNEAERLLFEIGDRRRGSRMVWIREGLRETFDRIEARARDKTMVTGVASGLGALDVLTGGFQPADLIVLAGRPAMGKTTIAGAIARYVAVTLKQPVLLFSLEMSVDQVIQRVVCAEAEVDSTKLRSGYLGEADWPRLAAAMSRLSEAPLLIDDTSDLTVLELRARARRARAKHGVALVIVDYLQLVGASGRAENRTQEVSEVARALKNMAKELGVPVIALSQLNRIPELMGSHRPQLSHLRESGDIEGAADLVILLYREDYYDLEKARQQGREGIVTLIVAKHRSGRTGDIEAVLDLTHGRMLALERGRAQ